MVFQTYANINRLVVVTGACNTVHPKKKKNMPGNIINALSVKIGSNKHKRYNIGKYSHMLNICSTFFQIW